MGHRVTRFPTPTGTGSSTCCPASRASTAGSPRTTAGSSTPSCGSPGPGPRGRTCPSDLGKGNSQWRRFDRWAKKGRWDPILAALRDPDLDVLILDSTAVRAHPCAAGAKKSGTGLAARTIRRWAAAGAGSAPRSTGVSTASGHPVELLADGGPGVGHRPGRGAAGRPRAGGGDRRQGVRQEGAGRGDRVAWGGGGDPDAEETARSSGQIDPHLYRERNVCERFWSKVKQYRRVATRYEKKAANFLAFVKVAAIMVMLK